MLMVCDVQKLQTTATYTTRGGITTRTLQHGDWVIIVALYHITLSKSVLDGMIVDSRMIQKLRTTFVDPS